MGFFCMVRDYNSEEFLGCYREPQILAPLKETEVLLLTSVGFDQEFRCTFYIMCKQIL